MESVTSLIAAPKGPVRRRRSLVELQDQLVQLCQGGAGLLAQFGMAPSEFGVGKLGLSSGARRLARGKGDPLGCGFDPLQCRVNAIWVHERVQ